MSDNDVVKKIITEKFPEACDRVGPTTVSDIVEGKGDFKDSPSGRFIDIWHLIQIITAAVTMVRFLMEIYPIVAARLKRKPTKQEMKDELEKSNTQKDHLKDNEIDALIDSVLLEKEP